MLSEQLHRGDFGLRFTSDDQVGSVWYDFSNIDHSTRMSILQQAILNHNPLLATIDFANTNTQHMVEPEDFALARFFEAQRNYLERIVETAAGLHLTPFPQTFIIINKPHQDLVDRIVEGLKYKPHAKFIVASSDETGEMQRATYAPFSHFQTGMNLSGIKNAMNDRSRVIVARSV